MVKNPDPEESFVSYELEHALQREPIKGTFSGMRTVLSRMKFNYHMHKLRQQKRQRIILIMIIAGTLILPLIVWSAVVYMKS